MRLIGVGNNIDLITKQYLEVLNDFKLWEVCVWTPWIACKAGMVEVVHYNQTLYSIFILIRGMIAY